MIENAVVLRGVTKRFGTQVAVDQLDLEVPSGTIFGFIGPNGSGKTTTMRMILRIYHPDEGQIQVLGEPSGSGRDDRLGYLPEERGLYRRMTVRQVLRYFARLKGIRKPDPLIDEHLERLQASDWDKKKIEQLSKGMAQKIQFIVAVISRPQLIILDEPFSGLDPVNMEVLRSEVMALKQAGTTVIFSTHDMDMAERMCDRVFMIYRGKKVLDGTLDAIKANYGGDAIRVRMANGTELPSSLPGVTEQTKLTGFSELQLSNSSMRPKLLRALAEIGDVERFETVKPSLHDIFVRIAQ